MDRMNNENPYGYNNQPYQSPYRPAGYNNGYNNGYNGGYGNNGYGGYMQNPGQKQKSRMGTGIALGLLLGFAISLMMAVLLIGAFLSSGILKVGINGEIYVQAVDVDDSNGIGSAIEHKLNTLDSLLDNFYFEDVDRQKATDEIFKAYIKAYGDKYTVYYTPEEYASLMESTVGKFYGIGAMCQKNEDGTIQIVQPYEDAPAYKAGLRAGDAITKIDGTDITDMELSAATALIKGEKGTSVTLDILRNGQPMTFQVARDEVKVQTVQHEMLADGIGYLAISQFDDVTVEQFHSALSDLKANGMQGLIIDVRSNPGGVLNSVVTILDEILPKGLIVYTKDKDGNERRYEGKDNSELKVPYAVLVNGSSASASEIFAGAVQDYGKGVIIGTKTFGKGIVQTVQPLSDGSAVKYTISKYFTPKGQDIHGKGVTPDQIVELPQGENAADTQMEAAISYLKDKLK